MNKKIFYLKSKPIQLTLPVPERQSVNFDAQGRPVLSSRPAAAAEPAAQPIPRWFAAVLGMLNRLLGVSTWWPLKAPPPREGLGTAMARLRGLAGIQPLDAGAADSPGLSPVAG